MAVTGDEAGSELSGVGGLELSDGSRLVPEAPEGCARCGGEAAGPISLREAMRFAGGPFGGYVRVADGRAGSATGGLEVERRAA